MPKYQCKNCNKEFNQKCHFVQHTTRKYSCQPTIGNIINNSNEPLSNSNNPSTNVNIYQQPQIVSIPTQTTTVSIPVQPTNYKCDYCDTTFTRKDNLTKHIKLRCKVKHQNKEEHGIFDRLLALEENNKQLEEKYKKLDKKNKRLEKKINIIKMI
jgi:transposase-like protein